MSNDKKGFTLVELLAVIVILAVVILIAVTAVIPRMNNAKKKALVDEALIYLNAAKEAYSFDPELVNASSCTNITDLNGKYVKKDSDKYKGAVKTTINDGVVSQTIYLTDGKYYVSGTDNIISSNVVDSMSDDFLYSCGDYSPLLSSDVDTNLLAYKLIMNQGGSSFSENIDIIDQRSPLVDFQTVESDESNSGLYKAEDDDGASFYYRGVVNNNWIDFGGFYWRIVRINGNGSIRMIYSGLSSSTHTGNDALIKNTTGIPYTYSTTVNSITTSDISGLTNNQITTNYVSSGYGHTYVGYMYNPIKTTYTFPDFDPDENNNLDRFIQLINVDDSKNDYYLFKNFDINTDCISDNSDNDTSVCTLKCRELGVDCISTNWYTHATSEGNYSTTAEGVSAESNPIKYIYTSDYKYTCWEHSNPTVVTNSDNTKSIYISCPLVSEIVGTVKDEPTNAVVKQHGFMSLSENDANTNRVDSNIKREIDLWYKNNIYNIKDSKNIYLEDYISDEIFCNDREADTFFPFPDMLESSIYWYRSYTRWSNFIPTLKCGNRSRDGFTLDLSSGSRVSANKSGNNMLKYPVATITSDEILYAGTRRNLNNNSMYLNIGKSIYSMTPAYVYSKYGQVTGVLGLNGSGRSLIWLIWKNATNGIRPVINLKANVLYDSGSGTEADPYKVKLPTT